MLLVQHTGQVALWPLPREQLTYAIRRNCHWLSINRRHHDRWPASSSEKLDWGGNTLAATVIGADLVVGALTMTVRAGHVGFRKWHISSIQGGTHAITEPNGMSEAS